MTQAVTERNRDSYRELEAEGKESRGEGEGREREGRAEGGDGGGRKGEERGGRGEGRWREAVVTHRIGYTQGRVE